MDQLLAAGLDVTFQRPTLVQKIRSEPTLIFTYFPHLAGRKKRYIP
jgi:hypothetical protein